MSLEMLIFGLSVSVFGFLFIIAISFVISRFLIKFFEKRTNGIWLLGTQTPQMSIAARLFLKISYLVYYIYVATICFVLSCWFFFGEALIQKIFDTMNDSLRFVGDIRLMIGIVFGVGLFLPYFIKALYYYKETGFKFLRIYVAIVCVYYALCSFMLISTLLTLAYENFNPEVLKPLKEAFLGLF